MQEYCYLIMKVRYLFKAIWAPFRNSNRNHFLSSLLNSVLICLKIIVTFTSTASEFISAVACEVSNAICAHSLIHARIRRTVINVDAAVVPLEPMITDALMFFCVQIIADTVIRAS